MPQHRSFVHRWLKITPKLACLVCSASTTVLVLITSPAYPWGSKGHEIIVAIAETQLNDTAPKRIKELLPQGTTLADASTWPDKAGRQIPDMDPYHFINFPKDANTYDQQRDCKLRNCIIEAIAWYTPVLKAPDAPRNEKRIAVRFVAHLVGDIHQPLHAGVAEDRGGNSIDVRFNGRKETCTHCGTLLSLS
jgi:nuclease S1